MVFFIDLPLDAIWLSLYRLFDVFFHSFLSALFFSFLYFRVCDIYVQFIRSHGFVTRKNIQSYVCPGKLIHTHMHTGTALMLYFGSKFDVDSFSLTAACVNSNTLLFIILALLLQYIVAFHCRLHNARRVCVSAFFSQARSFIHSPIFFCLLSFLPSS